LPENHFSLRYTWVLGEYADGMRLAAGVDFGQLYTSRPTPMPSTSTGVAGSISGRQYDAIDLQYAGNGVFLVRSSAGTFNVQ